MAPLWVVTDELVALLAECPRGRGGLVEHAYGWVRHGVAYIGDDAFPGCFSEEVVAELGRAQWLPTVRQAAHDRARRRRPRAAR